MNPFDDPDGVTLEEFRQALIRGEAEMTADRLLEVVEDLDTSPPFCAPELMRFENCAAPWIEVADATWPELALDVALAHPDLDEEVQYRFEMFTLQLARSFPWPAWKIFRAVLQNPDTTPELRAFCLEVVEEAGEGLSPE
jgi:hypothetical protein